MLGASTSLVARSGLLSLTVSFLVSKQGEWDFADDVFFLATALVDGEGTQREYWSYIDLINEGVIVPANSSLAYC